MKDRSTGNREVDIAVDALRKDTNQQFRGLVSSLSVVFGSINTGTSSSDRFLNPFSPQTAISTTEVWFRAYRPGVLQPFMVEILTIGAAAADQRVELLLRVNGKDTPMRVHYTAPKFVGLLRANQFVRVEKDNKISIVVRKTGALTTACDLGPLFLELK